MLSVHSDCTKGLYFASLRHLCDCMDQYYILRTCILHLKDRPVQYCHGVEERYNSRSRLLCSLRQDVSMVVSFRGSKIYSRFKDQTCTSLSGKRLHPMPRWQITQGGMGRSIAHHEVWLYPLLLPEQALSVLQAMWIQSCRSALTTELKPQILSLVGEPGFSRVLGVNFN